MNVQKQREGGETGGLGDNRTQNGGFKKWTVSVMLWLLQFNKKPLKAPLLLSLIPAGGLGCTKPLVVHTMAERWCALC